MQPTCHLPVLLEETLSCLDPQPGQCFVDGTLGGGGHTLALLASTQPNGRVIALDRDPHALDRFEHLRGKEPVHLAQANFSCIPEVLELLQISSVDGVILDLGLSSDQLADDERGFSFHSNGPLDLRFDPDEGDPAWKLLERLSQRHLADLLYEFGEERLSRRIAAAVVQQRESSPIRTASAFAELIVNVYPSFPQQRIHPATRSFQALRIAVNDELKSLSTALKHIPRILVPGGRLVVISFHSLEDRIVKRAIQSDKRLQRFPGKAVKASEKEIATNPRSRSARLRCAIRADRD